jgi:hypothetical protein
VGLVLWHGCRVCRCAGYVESPLCLHPLSRLCFCQAQWLELAEKGCQLLDSGDYAVSQSPSLVLIQEFHEPLIIILFCCCCICRCFRSWRRWATQQRSAEQKVHHARSRAEQRLASAVLQEWAELAWELPRERKAAALQVGLAGSGVQLLVLVTMCRLWEQMYLSTCNGVMLVLCMLLHRHS